MRQFHVISLSIGTAFLFCLLTLSLVVAILVATIDVHSEVLPNAFQPNTGTVGEIEHQINDLKYGPVNTDATKGVKNGLLDRIRSNRQSRLCPPVSQSVCSPVQVQTAQSYSYSQSIKTIRSSMVVQPSYQIVPQSTGIEYPSVPPINPLEAATAKDCPTCKSPDVKTGSFMCSNCRQSKIGEWHTDWNEDGTPTTFLCKACHAFMTPEQTQKALKAYQSRQLGKAGHAGLLHQEIGQ